MFAFNQHRRPLLITEHRPLKVGQSRWNFTNAIGVLPSVVFVAVTASAVKKRNWKSVIYCFGFPIFFSGLCYLVLMYTNGYFQETDPIRYVGSDRWIFFSMGAQATGGLMTIGLCIAWIHEIVQRRKHRFATRNSLSR